MSSATSVAGPARVVRRRRLVRLAHVALLGALLALGAFWIDLSRVGQAVAALTAGALAIYLVLMVGTRAIAALRWYLVATRTVGLSGVTVPLFVRTEMLAEFATLWLQTFVGGEAVRIWQVSRRSGQRGATTASVAVDRVIGTMVLLLACAPFLLPLRNHLPRAELPPGLLPAAAAGAAAALLLAAVGFWALPALRELAARGLRRVRGRRIPLLPVLVGATVYPVTVLAHWIAFPELAARGWIVTATVALVPRLGRAVPLSLFGLSAVEGSTLVIGAWLGIGTDTLVVVAALNLLAKYVSGGLGAVIELWVNGTRFFGEVRRPRPGDAEEMAERAIAGEGRGEP